jgi:hypothetical protein
MTSESHVTRLAFVSIALASALSACGSASPDTAELSDVGAAQNGSSGASAGGDKQEHITPGGIAVVVLDHLGPRAIRQVYTYEPEPGSVGLMIRLREGTRADMFAVTVYSPAQAGQFGPARKCPAKGGGGGVEDMQCRTLKSGLTVTTSEVAGGFSDDNADGMVVYGTAVTRDAGAAMAMYESYDDTPAVSAADLDGILTDPRLSWLTQPALNEAGEDVDVKKLEG